MNKFLISFSTLLIFGCVTPGYNNSHYNSVDLNKSFNQRACENGSSESCNLWTKEEVKKQNYKVAWEALELACHNGREASCQFKEKFEIKLRDYKNGCNDRDSKDCIAAANSYFHIGELDTTIFYLDEACNLKDAKACDMRIAFETLREQQLVQKNQVAQQYQNYNNQRTRQNFNNGLFMLNKIFNKPQQGTPAIQDLKCSTRPIYNINGKFIRSETKCE